MGNSNYNSLIHHRKSIRLKGYDYSRSGLYFITICTWNKKHLFGKIAGEKMVLNQEGAYAQDCWRAIPKHFPDAYLHEYIIMPNHVHGIIELQTLLTKPDQNRFQHLIPRSIGSIVKGFKIGVTQWFRYGVASTNGFVMDTGLQTLSHSPQTIQPCSNRKQNEPSIWQRNFYDHIIRDEEDYIRIKYYIINNPKNWSRDKFYTGKK